MTREIPCHHTTTQGPTDQGQVIQVKTLDEHRQVIGERIKLIALTRMIRSSTTPLIVHDTTYAARDERRYLILPHRSADGPSVNENKGLTRAPIRIIQTCSIMNSDKWHNYLSTFQSTRRGEMRTHGLGALLSPKIGSVLAREIFERRRTLPGDVRDGRCHAGLFSLPPVAELLRLPFGQPRRSAAVQHRLRCRLQRRVHISDFSADR